MINFKGIPHIFVGVFISFVCASNIILYEASLTQFSESVIPINPYLLSALLAGVRSLVFFAICLYFNLNSTLTKEESMNLILAGFFTGIFRVCTFKSVSDTNSSIYANYCNIDILFFWFVDYLNSQVKLQYLKIECCIIFAIVICSFLANDLIQTNNDLSSNIEGCVLAIVATIACVIGITCYSKTINSECNKIFRCTIMFSAECIFSAFLIPLGNIDEHYNIIIYVLFVANLVFAFTTYTIIDTFGATFLSINMALVIIWSYLYVLIVKSVDNVIGSCLSMLLLFVLVVVYNLWKEHAVNINSQLQIQTHKQHIKRARHVQFENPNLLNYDKLKKNYQSINDDDGINIKI